MTAEELERFTDRLIYLARGCSHCVLAGSLPPGAPNDFYARLISELRGVGVPVILDADGEPMRAGLKAQPAIVAPNITEAEEAVGFEFGELGDPAEGLRGLLELGAEEAYVTSGHGCMAIAGPAGARNRYEASIDPLEPVAAAGSGDAFLAGLVSADRAGLGVEAGLAFAVACGAESTQHLGAGALDPAEVARLVDRVTVSRIDARIGVS